MKIEEVGMGMGMREFQRCGLVARGDSASKIESGFLLTSMESLTHLTGGLCQIVFSFSNSPHTPRVSAIKK